MRLIYVPSGSRTVHCVIIFMLWAQIMNFVSSSISFHKILKRYTKSKEEIEYCKKSKTDKITCLVGPGMLSRHGVFYKTLQSRANKDKLIILSFVDISFVEMAINLYDFSLRPLNIRNYIFVCTDEKAYVALERRGIYSFLYPHNLDKEPSTFGTRQFMLKTRIKIKITTAAVMLGFRVLLTDVDVVFVRNPIAHLPADIDLAIQDDMIKVNIIQYMVANDLIDQNFGALGQDFGKPEFWDILNTGFMVVSPTYGGVEMMQRTLSLVMDILVIDQPALNVVVKDMLYKKSLTMVKLSRNKFPCGKAYFENRELLYPEDSKHRNINAQTVIVHNNHYHTKYGKIHRFKENGLWSYDVNKYYTNKKSLYIMYKQPLDSASKNLKQQKYSLMTALTLGHLLGRIVILPKFNCHGCKNESCEQRKLKQSPDHCTFNAHFYLEAFNKYFKNKYRESVFLNNTKVPDMIKKSISPQIHIVDNQSERYNKDLTAFKNDWSNITVHVKNAKKVLSSEVMNLFGKGRLSEYSVLNFHSLNFHIVYKNSSWWNTVSSAFLPCDYNQNYYKTVKSVKLQNLYRKSQKA